MAAFTSLHPPDPSEKAGPVPSTPAPGQSVVSQKPRSGFGSLPLKEADCFQLKLDFCSLILPGQTTNANPFQSVQVHLAILSSVLGTSASRSGAVSGRSVFLRAVSHSGIN